MDIRPHAAMWSALAFMACAAPIAWMWGLRPGWDRGDVLALVQTIFSVGALVAALGVAVFEHRRAERADERRRNAYVRLGRKIITVAILTLKPFAHLTMGEPVPYEQVRSQFEGLHGAINAIRASVPPDAELAVWLVNLSQALDPTTFLSRFAHPGFGHLLTQAWNEEAGDRISQLQDLFTAIEDA